MNIRNLFIALCLLFLLSLSSDGYANSFKKAVLLEKVTVGGKLQLDTAHFLHDELGIFIDRQRVRRARISTKMALHENWLFELDYDFAREDRSAIRDVLVQYNKPSLNVTVGQFKEPFSMERISSRRDLGFMERSLVSALSPGRTLGIAVQHYSHNYTFSTGLFGSDISAYNETTTGLSSRLTFVPQSKPGFINHIGTSLSYRKPSQNTDLRYRQRIETRNSDIRLIDTDTLFADNYLLMGLEAAIARDSLSVTAEYINNYVNNAYQMPNQAATDVFFSGWHIDFSWIITGEPQTYNHQKGTFGRLIPASSVTQGGIGAWKFSSRLSQLDLNDSLIRGGKQQNLTTNLTWVLNKNINIMAEYVKVLSIENTQSEPMKPDFLQARLEMAF